MRGRQHVILCVVLFCVIGAREARAQTVALVPLLGSGFGADELADDERLIRAEVDAHFGKKSIPAATLQTRMQEAMSIGLRCDRSTVPCLVQLGVVCQADRVLLALIAPAADADPARHTATLALRLVDVGAAGQIAYASRAIQGAPRAQDVSALLGALELPAARALTVDVRGPAGVHVFIDGTERAILPLAAPLTDVAAGKHEVRLTSDTATDVVDIDVRAGEPVIVDVPAHAAEPAPGSSSPNPALSSAAAEPGAAAAFSASTVVLTAGAVVAAAGVVGVVVGALPFFAHEQAATDLERLDAGVGTSAAKLRDNEDAIRAARGRLDDSAAAWDGYGAASFIGGVVAVAVGAGVAAGGAIFSE